MGTNNLKLILQLYKGKWCIGVGIGQYICVKWWYMRHTKLIWIPFLKIKWSECQGEIVMSFPVRITNNSWSSEKIYQNRRLFYPPSDDILTHFCTLFTLIVYVYKSNAKCKIINKSTESFTPEFKVEWVDGELNSNIKYCITNYFIKLIIRREEASGVGI